MVMQDFLQVAVHSSSQRFTHPSVYSHILKLVFPGDLFLIGLKEATKSLNVLQHMAKNVMVALGFDNFEVGKF